MADLSDLQVEIDLNENDLGKVQMGQKTEIRLDSNPDVVFKGEVDEIAPPGRPPRRPPSRSKSAS